MFTLDGTCARKDASCELNINGLAQDYNNSSALAIELLHSCAGPFTRASATVVWIVGIFSDSKVDLCSTLGIAVLY